MIDQYDSGAVRALDLNQGTPAAAVLKGPFWVRVLTRSDFFELSGTEATDKLGENVAMTKHGFEPGVMDESALNLEPKGVFKQKYSRIR